jgi:hypothetical protein
MYCGHAPRGRDFVAPTGARIAHLTLPTFKTKHGSKLKLSKYMPRLGDTYGSLFTVQTQYMAQGKQSDDFSIHDKSHRFTITCSLMSVDSFRVHRALSNLIRREWNHSEDIYEQLDMCVCNHYLLCL